MKNIILWIKEKGVNRLPDVMYLKRKYRKVFGEELDLQNPKKMSEKLQWLKLYNRDPFYNILVDKVKVKKYVAEKIGKEHIVPTLGIWERFEDIDFDKLPNQFVLKCTHDSGSFVICDNKESLDIDEARKTINKALHRNYFWESREWPYKNVKPRIIADKFLSVEGVGYISDYSFYCFNGEPKLIMISTKSDSEFTEVMYDFFDMEGNHVAVDTFDNPDNFMPKIPENFAKMRELADILAEGIPFVRVDFYEVGDKIYFGELTFFPDAGFDNEIKPYWDRWLGDLLELDLDRKIINR